MNRVAVLIPCYNEELTIDLVIEDFIRYLPEADIYVYDNNSTDMTYAIASLYEDLYKVHVMRAPEQGKGNVVKKMFSEVSADIYLMVDGDNTYHAEDARALVDGIRYRGYHMMLGDRLSFDYDNTDVRKFHGIGNKIVKFLVNFLYHGNMPDILTGYRAFSRKFVDDVVRDIKSQGFEIETELCILALKNNMKTGCVSVRYTDRPDGSFSKLDTFKDGIKVIRTIFSML